MTVKIKYNNELEHINTEEKAYLIGYLYGDGCIHSRINKNKKSFTYLTTITSIDLDILEKIKNNFKFFNLSNRGKYYTISSYSRKLYEDLLNNGLFERKSIENKDNLRLPKLDENLIPHFIRGLYDADGGYYLYGTLLETFTGRYPVLV